MKQKKKVFQKFKKKSVVAPVIIFFIALIISSFIGVFIIGAEMAGVIQKKFYTEKKLIDMKGANLAKQINGGNVRSLIDESEDGIILLKDSEIVYSNRDDAELMDFSVTVDETPFEIYLAKNQGHNVEDGASISFTSRDIRMRLSLYSLIRAIFVSSEDTVISEVSVWIPSASETEEGKLLYNSDIKLLIEDIEFSVVVILASAILISVLAVILFINIFTSAYNNNKMLRALYFDDKTLGNNWLYLTTKAGKLIRNRKYCYEILAVKCKRYDHYRACSGVDSADEILRKTFTAIKRKLDKKDLIARNSDSYFGVVIRRNSYDDIQSLVNEIVDETEEEIRVGIYLIGERDKSSMDSSSLIEDYFHFAKIACDSIPDSGEKRVAFFDKKMKEDHQWLIKVENTMERALADKEFVVYVQPKYDPKSSTLKGAEALIRWVSPEDGFISPGRFIPIFEQNGFITKIDDFMVSEVSRLQSQWIAQGFRVVPVSVNVSRVHFMDPNLAEHICALVDRYNTPHDVIEIELTESAFFDDKKALLSTVKKLQDLGFHVSMDDFGSGYSSLNSLKDLSLNVLKLDAEFFRGENKERRGEIIVEKAIELAKELDMEIVAEGIEQKEQVDFLADLDCDMIQGFYFAKPLPLGEYESRMERLDK